MHVWPYYVSGRSVWFSDQSAGGLYTYDCENEEVHCVIKPDVLFSYNIFMVSTLVCWKTFVFAFSDRLNGTHIVYNKVKNEIKKFGGLEEKAEVNQAIIVGEILYLIPFRIRDYIYETNLADWDEMGSDIKFVKRSIGKGITMRTWLPKSDGHILYLPEFGGKRVFAIKNNEIKVIKLEIPSELNTIGVFGNELWAVPLYGEYIFSLTLDGKIKEKIKISRECAEDGKTDIWEIGEEKEFVFCVHWRRPEIDIYNRKSKKTMQIDGAMFTLHSEDNVRNKLYYLPYVTWKNGIRFFPSMCSLLEIELPDLVYQSKKNFFPKEILDEEWDYWCRTICRYKYCQKILLKEESENELETFLKCISVKISLDENGANQKNTIGKEIYFSGKI